MNTVTVEYAFDNKLLEKGTLIFDNEEEIIEEINQLFNHTFELVLISGRVIIVSSNYSIEYWEN